MKLSQVNCKYGAPMGRPSQMPAKQSEEMKFYLKHIPLNNGGYDSGGAYWGLGQRLYWACSVEEHDTNYRGKQQIELYFRAADRENAKLEVLSKFPKASFFR